MSTFREKLIALVHDSPGLTDRELTDRLVGKSAGQQAVNQAARSLVSRGHVIRKQHADGKIGNYPASKDGAATVLPVTPARSAHVASGLSEDDVKRCVKEWLESDGWQVVVRWGRERGTDNEATRDGGCWVIEAKGCGSLNAMRVNYFLGMLGEILQRMDDVAARYSIALPDIQQFRRLWERLPEVAKSRTRITALFVSTDGAVVEVR